MSAATQLPKDVSTLPGTPSPDPSTDTYPRRYFRSFVVIWAAQLVARVRNGLTAFGLGVCVYQQLGLSTVVPFVTLVAFLPSLLLSPFGGVLVDRYDRHLLMVFGDTSPTLGLLVMIVASHTDFVSVSVIRTCVALNSVFSPAMNSVYRATIIDLLTPEQYVQAGGSVQLASTSQYLISPAIAGLFMTSSGIATVLTIDTATMVLTVTCILLVWRIVKTPSRRTTAGFWADFRRGISFLRRHLDITVLVVLIIVVTLCMGFLQTPPASMLLGLTNESTPGAIRPVAAVGMVAAGLVTDVFNTKGTHLIYITCFLAAGSVLIFLLGITTSILVIGVLALIFFMTLPPFNTNVEVTVRSSIPNEVQGKVWGLMGLTSQLGYVVAYTVSGVLADSVFNPLLRGGGTLASSPGVLTGVGTSHGIGLMLMIVGVLLIGMAVAVPCARSICSLQNNLPLTERKDA